MAKLKVIIYGIMMLSIYVGCQPNYQFRQGQDNLIFHVYQFEKLDLKTNTYYLEYGMLKDTIHDVLTTDEKTAIIKSFQSNKMWKIQGEESFFTGYPTMPPSNLIIRHYQAQNLRAEILINDEFIGDVSIKERRVKKFYDDFLYVFNNNGKIKDSERKIKKYNEEHFPNIPLLL